jgi:polyhydroxyalkanoate synthesis regulator phasin
MSTHLEEQSQIETPAYAPSVTAADEFGKFMQTLANNKNIENKPQNAKTYAEYLTYIGSDPVGEYNAKVRQANLEYAKGLATFGQVAEKMARSGLTGSGYGDYLHGLAYQGKQSAVGAAQQEAQAAMKQSFASYGDYLTGINSTNEQNAINGILSGLLEGEAAENYAREQGVVDDDRLAYVLSQTSANVSAANAQKEQEKRSLVANATDAMAQLVDGGMSVDAAKAYLNGRFDDDVLAQAVGNLQESTNVQAGSAIQTATGVSDFKAQLDQQKGVGALTGDNYTEQLSAAQDKNYEFVQKALEGDFSGLSAYADAAGIDISAGTDEQLEAVVDSLEASGHITSQQRQKFYSDLRMQSIKETSFTTKEAVGEAEIINNLCSAGKISQAQRDELLGVLNKRTAELHGKVEITGANIVVGRSSGNVKIRLKYNIGSNTGEGIDITLRDDLIVDGNGFVEAYSFEKNGKTLKLGSINGRLAYFYNGKYYSAKSGTPNYLNTKSNAALVAHVVSTKGEDRFSHRRSKTKKE